MTRALVVFAVIALSLAACGKRGDLERPEPMWDAAPVTPAR